MKTKEQLIEYYLKKPVEIGESVYIKGLGSQSKESWFNTTKVVAIGEDDSIYYKTYGYREPQLAKKGDWKKDTNDIGANPFPAERETVRNINFTLESVIHKLQREREYEIKGIKIESCNWNPYIYRDGKKEYYQRPFVWSIQDKQNLIESIYNGIDCGKILIRQRGWKELEGMAEKGETELAWNDIVDGKQRMNAILEFMDNKYPDQKANYYRDLSYIAQNRLTNHQLFSYSEMDENTKDEDVITQFLKLNFTGVPQSAEHINFVKSLLK